MADLLELPLEGHPKEFGTGADRSLRFSYWVPTRAVRRSDRPLELKLDTTGYRGIVALVELPCQLAEPTPGSAPLYGDSSTPVNWQRYDRFATRTLEVTVSSSFAGEPSHPVEEVESWLEAWGLGDDYAQLWQRWLELYNSGEMEAARADFDERAQAAYEAKRGEAEWEILYAAFRESLAEFAKVVAESGQAMLRGFMIASVVGSAIFIGAQLLLGGDR